MIIRGVFGVIIPDKDTDRLILLTQIINLESLTSKQNENILNEI